MRKQIIVIDGAVLIVGAIAIVFAVLVLVATLVDVAVRLGELERGVNNIECTRGVEASWAGEVR